LYRIDATLRGKCLSANTLASFVVLQGLTGPEELTATRGMNAAAWLHLNRRTALDYWLNHNWLVTRGEQLFLTEAGLTKIQNRLTGRDGANSVTHHQVAEAMNVILRGECSGCCGSAVLVAAEFPLALSALPSSPVTAPVSSPKPAPVPQSDHQTRTMGNVLRLVNWNVEWVQPRTSKGTTLLTRIFNQNPDLICLTEGYTGFLPDSGYEITSAADYGYSAPEGRRKVLLWSKTPWQNVDQIGQAQLPPGRFVRAETETAIGRLTVIGVCIPWADAHVRSGQKNRQRWEDHLQYLTHLDRILGREQGPVIVVGDYNQRVPKFRSPQNVYDRLDQVIRRRLTLATEGLIPPIGSQTIDHIASSSELAVSKVLGLSNSADGQQLSDHFGIVAELKRR
jgi:endonuclease/exonuclease/phosphatase family metal-dependent hydrolase